MYRFVRKDWPLGTKLTLLMTILTIVAVASITLSSIRREQRSFRAEQQRQAELILDTLSAAGADHLYFLDIDRLSGIVERLSQDPAVVLARFYDPEGRIVADAHNRGLVRSFESDPFGQQLVGSDTIVLAWQSDRLVAGKWVGVEGQRLGAVSVGLSTASLTSKVAAARRQGLHMALAVAAIGILLAFLLSRSITGPIGELVRATERIARGDLTQRVALRGGDEFTVLAEALNSMTARFQTMIESIERYALDLELRNRELLALQAAGTAIASSLDLQHVLETVAREMAHLVGAEACAISEWDQVANTVSLVFEYGPGDWWDEGSQEEVFSLADYPLTKRVLVERCAEQVTISQPDTDPAELAYMKEINVNTLVMLPMVFQDRVVGLAELMNWMEHPLTGQEIALAKLLANQAASAIENARLYEKAQQEIAKRKQIEERIRASLKEKEVLLREIHHRVKNNLQIVSGLLLLQSGHTKDKQVLKTLQESQNRVHSMAAIHETLYRSEDLARVDFADYIQKLANQLLRSYDISSQTIALQINVAKGSLGVDAAISCGLIINELISNSLKYAFPAGRTGEIRIDLYSDHDNRLILTVSDNGIGFPPHVEFRNVESLGLQLVTMLTEQLEGTIELDRSSGTAFKIVFSQ